MNRKKKNPDPYKRSDSPYYCFTDNTDPKRPRRSTGKRGKEDARDYIRDYIDSHSRGTDLTLREYAEPFFIWETSPRVRRRLDEGKSMGKTHVEKLQMLSCNAP